MTPERWQVIKTILADALEKPVAERDAFVGAAAAGDQEIRREVLSLLAANEGEAAIDVPAANVALDRGLQDLLGGALGRQYDLIRPLGHGGMGDVYLARETALERFVAIKVLRPDLAAAPDSRERFRREARVAAQLSHPGILPLHTFGEVSGLWYFVMGYVRGVSLAERLRLEGRLPHAVAHRILLELADALECAHRHGVIHRDIKPANILIDDDSGRVLLADFGIAKVRDAGDSLTGAGAIVGTPHFMSPEQSIGAPSVDERSDVYSLGAVGYTMLVGHEPFAAVASEELTLHRLSRDPPDLATIAPSVPRDLASIIMRCLARERGDRWPNARSLRDALRTSGDALASLPESLRDLPTFGPYALIWAALWTGLAFGRSTETGDRVLLLLIAVVVPVGFLLHIWNAGREGLGLRGIASVAFWPPEWWGMWWPGRLRRPTDLWPRLPKPARAFRIALSVFLFTLPTMILFRHPLESAVGEGGPLQWFGMVESALVIGTAIVTTIALTWAYRYRLSWSDTVRILVGATAPSPGWATPAMHRFLSRPAGAAGPPERDTPAEYRRAIVGLVAVFPAAAVDAGAETLAVTQRLLAHIEACDVEIECAKRDASDGELERLSARLASLETSPGGHNRPELAAVVRKELDLLRETRSHAELIALQRARLFDLLRGLWTHVSATLDAAQDPGELDQSVRRLRALNAQVLNEVGDQPPEISRLSQARAVAHSRLTVAGETSSASAVSSMPRPPK